MRALCAAQLKKVDTMAEQPEHEDTANLQPADRVAQTADVAPPSDQALPEPCPFCGERHPRSVKCADWARAHGTVTAAPWGSEGFAALPPPPMLRERPAPRQPSALSPTNLLKGALVLLALYGAIMLALTLARHAGGSNSTSAALPACSPDRVRQNLLQANTLIAEANAATPQRVAGTAALALAPSADCSDELYDGYAQLLSDQMLCFITRSQATCNDRNTVFGEVTQSLSGS